MPIYTIEGRDVETDGPLSDDDIDEIAAQIRKTAPAPKPAAVRQPVAQTPPSWTDVLRSAPVKAITGPLDAARNALLEPIRLGQRMTAFGRRLTGVDSPTLSGLIAGQQKQTQVLPQLPDITTAQARRLGLIADTSGMTAEQRLADVALQSATGSLLGPAAGARSMLMNFLSSGTAGGLGQAATEITGSPYVGMGVSLLAPGAASYAVRKPAAIVKDVFSPQQRAARLAKGTAAPTIDEVRAAISKHPDKPVSEALMLEGVNNPAMQSLAQITGADDIWTEALRRATSQEEIDALAELAGGATHTGAALARKAEKTALNERLVPQLESALERAGLGGTLGRQLEAEAGRAGAAASGAVEDVRRFTAASDRANEWARNWRASGTGEGPTGLPRPPTAATYPGELAGRAEQVAGQAAETSLVQGQMRREAERHLEALSAAGIKPLRPDSVIAGIRSKLRDPKIAGDEDAQNALNRVMEMMQDWTNQFGDITPEALDSIRKFAVNPIVEKLMSGATQQAKKRFAAGLMKQINPLIRSAIEDAGGKGYIKYLDDYTAGMRVIERQKMASEAMRLYNENPDEFVALVRGDRPDMVEDIFGPGRIDIATEMGDKFAPLKKVADRLSRTGEAKRLAGEGQRRLREVAEETSSKLYVPNLLSRPAAIANQTIKLLEGRVDRKTTQLLVDGFKQGKNLEELLKTIPFKDRVTVRDTFRRSAILRPGAIAATINALSPNATNNNALSE